MDTELWNETFDITGLFNGGRQCASGDDPALHNTFEVYVDFSRSVAIPTIIKKSVINIDLIVRNCFPARIITK